MMKTIKIIDLFIEYTKTVKQPEKIRFKDKLYIYNGHAVLSQLIKDYGIDIVNLLNDEVEILEDEKKIPEKLEDYDFDDSLDANTKCECLREIMQEIENQLDEIIDYLQYFKNKGDE